MDFQGDNMGKTIGDIFSQGGWVMWPLLTFSVITWAVIIERTYVFLTLRPRLSRLAQSVLRSLQSGDPAAARQLCLTEGPQLSSLFLGSLDQKKTREQAERLTERSRARMMGYMKRNLWILGTIGSASPFVGLLGTVLGIVRAFHSMQEKASGGLAVVGAGISEALIATAFGLVVAIIALLTYNIFVTAANQTLGGLKLALEEILDQAYDGGMDGKVKA